MTVLSSAAVRPRRSELMVVAGLALAAAIAWIQPFDRAFDAATFGVAPARAALIVLLALAGLALGAPIGLTLEGNGRGRPLRDALTAALAVAVFCAACDWIGRGELHAGYRAFLLDTPLFARTVVFAARAVNENIIYRLFLSTLMIRLIGLVWRDAGRPAGGAYWTGFALAQLANVWINVAALAPLTPLGVAHDLARYAAPGLVWSWLFWKRGFAANELASTSVHLFFQPLVVLGL